MINRYEERQVVLNEKEMYTDLFNKRNVLFIRHYKSPTFTFPEKIDLARIQIIEHIWSVGDRFSKLANLYYGDPRDWWVIAKYNKKPTEAHIKNGDVISIPTPISEVLRVIRG